MWTLYKRRRKFGLEIIIKENFDIDEFNKLAPNFNLTEKLNCLEKLIKDNNDENFKIYVYILQKGLTKQRESQVQKLKDLFKLNLPNYEDGICLFEILKENGLQ